MRQFYVSFLPQKHRPHQPYDILHPESNTQRQFDTLSAAQACRDFNQNKSDPEKISKVGFWEVIDLWATRESRDLVIVR